MTISNKSLIKPESKATTKNLKQKKNKRTQIFKNNQTVIVHIKATFNNTLLTLTNFQGQVLTWASAGSCGFKGARKGTPFAAKKVVDFFIKKSFEYFTRCQHIEVRVCGIGPRQRKCSSITFIREVTKIPHNGCRPPKKRRV
uniref:Small ribosomal subunit protein uS11c n=1 Tax=Boodleopsis sp. FL1161 TaxID=2364084 RepID=A0A386AZ93_9CHLO|nr:ribosomal protein S11 [Boodleopsis sp. FL1161]